MSLSLHVMSSIVESDEDTSLVETDEKSSTMETEEEAEGRFPPQRQRELEMAVIKHDQILLKQRLGRTYSEYMMTIQRKHVHIRSG